MELIMTQRNCEIEPWLHKISLELNRDVSGFIKFLTMKVANMDQTGLEEKQVSEKLNELMRYEAVANSVLSAQRFGENFVDAFKMNNESFKIYNMKQGPVFVLLDSKRENLFEESKEETSVVTGFLLRKCLRKVRTKYEARDIYRAIKVEVDLFSLALVSCSKEEFIVKRVQKILNNEQATARLRREFKVQSILSELKHPAINELVAYCEDKHSMFGVSKLAGDLDLLYALQEEIKLKGKTFEEDRVRQLFKPAVEGLVVAHNLGFAHRDLSLENLVVNGDKCEIIDWGHSCTVAEDGLVKFEGPIGKERYFSPEFFSDMERYDPFKSDVFALGVSLYSSLTGQMPFTSINDERAKILKRGVRQYLEICKIALSEEAIDLLEGCLCWDSEKRFDMKAVLEHRFFCNM